MSRSANDVLQFVCNQAAEASRIIRGSASRLDSGKLRERLEDQLRRAAGSCGYMLHNSPTPPKKMDRLNYAIHLLDNSHAGESWSQALSLSIGNHTTVVVAVALPFLGESGTVYGVIEGQAPKRVERQPAGVSFDGRRQSGIVLLTKETEKLRVVIENAGFRPLLVRSPAAACAIVDGTRLNGEVVGCIADDVSASEVIAVNTIVQSAGGSSTVALEKFNERWVAANSPAVFDRLSNL